MFANLGSDHPGLIEALAQAKAEGHRADLPELIVCPHETVALSAAHAYAAVSGQPQAVLVHVDSGTQNLGGAVNNASRGRVPVLIFAGAAPYTIEGELPGSRHPLVVTGYLGRDTAAVPELVALCDLLAIPVIESAPHHVNFPASHPMHAGYQWTTKDQNPVLAEADVILAIDSDVPWITVSSRPAPDAEIYCVDIDPLKSQMPMWHIPARTSPTPPNCPAS